jgi:polyphosphate kinase
MTRNLDYRVEVGCPIYDPEIQLELTDTFNMAWNDNVKARILSDQQESPYRINLEIPVRSQFDMYAYYQKKLTE